MKEQVRFYRNMTGGDRLSSFTGRHCLFCQSPQATWLGRAMAFNRHTFGEYYDNLFSTMYMYCISYRKQFYSFVVLHFYPQKYSFNFILDFSSHPTWFSTLMRQVSLKCRLPSKWWQGGDRMQVGLVTSGERGELVTLICAVNAVGNTISLMSLGCVLPWSFHQRFSHCPIDCSTKSGWTD